MEAAAAQTIRGILDELAIVLRTFDIVPLDSPRRSEDEVRHGLRSKLLLEPHDEVVAYFAFVERYGDSVNMGPEVTARAFDDPYMLRGLPHADKELGGEDPLVFTRKNGLWDLVFAGSCWGDFVLSPASKEGPAPRVLLYAERSMCLEIDGDNGWEDVAEWSGLPTLCEWLEAAVRAYRSGLKSPNDRNPPREYPWKDPRAKNESTNGT